MSALHLYPLSCALNRAVRWTLDSWLARSLQLLPSGQRQPKRQLRSTLEKVEKKECQPEAENEQFICFLFVSFK